MLVLNTLAYSAQLTRLHDDVITNGSAINANDLNDEFNQLVNESNAQDTRLNSQEQLNQGVRTSDPITPTNGQLWYNTTNGFFKAQVSGSTRRLLDVNPTSGVLNLSQTSDPGTLSNGDIWFNSTLNEYRGRVSGVTRSFLSSQVLSPYRFLAGPAPEYATASTLTVRSGLAVMDETGNAVINVPSNITLNLATSGLNGLDTGTEVANTWYYVWLIRRSSDGAVGALFSTSLTTPILPSGYDQRRRLPLAVRNDAASDIIPFWVTEGWPYRPKIVYNVNIGDRLNIGSNNVLNNGAATTFTTVALNTLVPPIARIAILKGDHSYSSTQGSLRLRERGFTHEGYQIFTNNSTANVLYETIIGCNTGQEIEYRSSAASTSSFLWVVGYIITEFQ